MKNRKLQLKEIVQEVLEEAKELSGPMKHIFKQFPPAWSGDQYRGMIINAIESIASKQKQQNLTFKKAFEQWSKSGESTMAPVARKRLFDGIKKSGDAYLQVKRNIKI